MNDLPSLLGEVAKQGLLAILLTIVIYGLVKMFSKYAEVQEKRIAEAQSNYRLISELTQAVRELTQSQRERRG